MRNGRNEAGQITGQGLIGGQYHAYLLTPIPLPGDLNNNGVVDAADYVVWRKNNSTQQGYDTWRANVGEPAGSGSGGTANTNVPKPATALLLMIAAVGWCLRRERDA